MTEGKKGFLKYLKKKEGGGMICTIVHAVKLNLPCGLKPCAI
jgi:hypothetical protein